ncbi:S8 family peptidase [Prosthecomicrobium sp. N25]|uniref:S8 family peptidase n=1 Tax=Prosthecomicrobium sp. N25 TaxID=3129254 RepID=UPI003077F572
MKSISALLLAALALGVVTTGPSIAQQRQPPAASAQLKSKFPDLDRARLAQDSAGRISVILVLKPAAPDWKSALRTAPGLARVRSETRSVQDEVLRDAAGIAPADEPGRGVRRFDTFPMLAFPATLAELERLANHPKVESIQVDEGVPLQLDQSTPLIGATTAWTAGADGSGFAVAVLDTGVQRSHPMFTGKIVGEACFSGAGSTSGTLCPNGATTQTGQGAAEACASTLSSSCFHGTHVSGIAIGQNRLTASPKAGTALNGSLVPVQVFTNAGGSLTAYWSDIIAALQWVLTQDTSGAFGSTRIGAVNLSVGGGLYASACDSSFGAMKSALDSLRAAGILTAIAAGNNSTIGSVSAPGCISSAITVSSTTKSDLRSSFSNISDVTDVYAPGSSIYSATLGSGYVYASGTSMAAPHVAGSIAAMRTANPAATADQIEDALKVTGKPIADSGYTKQRIRVDLAASSLASATPPPPPPPAPDPSLAIGPSGDYAVSGGSKGGYTPSSMTYTLTGVGGSVSFKVDGNGATLPGWLSVTPTSGTATTSGTAVTLSVKSSAARQLAPGTYTATVRFLNTLNGLGTGTRTVTLTRR